MGESASYRLRITKITESGLVRQIEAEFEDAAIYTNAPPSAEPAGVPEQSIEPAGSTRLQLLDIPILRDTDNGPGFYAAAGRYLPGWPGATIYASADAGQTPACGKSLRLPAGRRGLVHCPACRRDVEVRT